MTGATVQGIESPRVRREGDREGEGNATLGQSQSGHPFASTAILLPVDAMMRTGLSLLPNVKAEPD